MVNRRPCLPMRCCRNRIGPGDATRSVVLYIYEIAFRTFNMGYAAAVSMTLFAIILVLTALQFWISRRWVYYE